MANHVGCEEQYEDGRIVSWTNLPADITTLAQAAANYRRHCHRAEASRANFGSAVLAILRSKEFPEMASPEFMFRVQELSRGVDGLENEATRAGELLLEFARRDDGSF